MKEKCFIKDINKQHNSQKEWKIYEVWYLRASGIIPFHLTNMSFRMFLMFFLMFYSNYNSISVTFHIVYQFYVINIDYIKYPVWLHISVLRHRI